MAAIAVGAIVLGIVVLWTQVTTLFWRRWPRRTRDEGPPWRQHFGTVFISGPHDRVDIPDSTPRSAGENQDPRPSAPWKDA